MSRRTAYLLTIVPFIVCLMAAATRFAGTPVILPLLARLHIIDGIVDEPSFLSTIGNINWYGGFLSVCLPLGAGLFLTEDMPLAHGASGAGNNRARGYVPDMVSRVGDIAMDRVSERRLGARNIYIVIYLYVLLISLVTQGSDAAYLSLAALFLMALPYCLRETVLRERLSILLMILGAAAETVTLFRNDTAGGIFHAYENEALTTAILKHHTGGWVILAGGILFILSAATDTLKADAVLRGISGPLVAAASCAAALAPVVILYLQYGQFFPMEKTGERGMIWELSAELFKTFTPARKLFGAGPDCYHAILSGHGEYSVRLFDTFGDLRLTNAHSEYFTLLINGGYAGALMFLLLTGLVLTASARMILNIGRLRARDLMSAWHSDKDTQSLLLRMRAERALFTCILIITSYLAYNTVSFRQVLSTPYIYMVMGIAVRYAVIADKKTA